MEADDLPCSRNARPEKALVGRAQWKINQSPSLERNEQAWTEHVNRSTRSCEVTLPFLHEVSERRSRNAAVVLLKAGHVAAGFLFPLSSRHCG